MRGTLKGIEVERRGGEQARRNQAGSLKPLQDLQYADELSGPASAPLFCSHQEHLTYSIPVMKGIIFKASSLGSRLFSLGMR